MDFITVDVTDVPPELTRRGAWVEVMGAARHRRRPDRPRRHHRLRAAVPARPARLSRLRGGGGLTRMARPARSQFVCQNCGAVAPRWAGKCVACGEWNTLVEEADAAAAAGLGARARRRKGRVVALETLAKADRQARAHPDRPRRARPRHRRRHRAGLGAADRRRARHRQVDAAAAAGRRLRQAPAAAPSTSRARRRRPRCACAPSASGCREAPLALACETNLANILATLERRQARRPRRHRLHPDAVGRCARGRARHGQPGARRHAVAGPLRQGAGLPPCVLVGHVTKDGQIAGPKVIEHMVDTVLYFEGDRGHRLPHPARRQEPLRRHRRDRRVRDGGRGPARGRQPLRAVPRRPRWPRRPGSAVFAGVEGTRPILVEIQALVVPSGLGTPRRAVVGWDANRLSMLLAVHRCPLRRQLRPARRLSQCRRRPEDHRAGGRPGRRSRPAVVDFQCCAAAGPASTSGRSACRGRSGRPATC